MTNATKKGKRPGKAPADSDKVLKILTEARQVVDDLGSGTAAVSPPPEKKSAALAKKSPSSRSTAATARKPASRQKPAAAQKATTPKKSTPSPAKAKTTAKAAPQPPVKAPSAPLLSPQECGIQVLHSLPGRIRFRVKSLQYDDDLARDMETKLAAIKGIAEVGASPATGSLLISYHSKKQVADPLGEVLKTWFPRLDTDSLLAEMEA
jgi:Heavy metal associated domain 2